VGRCLALMPVKGNIAYGQYNSIQKKAPFPKYHAFIYSTRSSFMYMYNEISHMQSLNLNLLFLFNNTNKIIGHEDIFPAVLPQGKAGRDPCRVPKKESRLYITFKTNLKIILLTCCRMG
jgi:hypothetical protein